MRVTEDGETQDVDSKETIVDSRTLLPDRDSFYRDMASMVDSDLKEHESFALLVIEVNGLEFVLRTFGPDERDVVVKEIGTRIRSVMEGKQPLYHISQGRFALIQWEGDYKRITNQAEAITDALNGAFNVAGTSYNLEAQVGISLSPNHADTISELVRTAVFACHQARLSGSNYRSFDKELDDWERYRFRLLTDLESALENQNGLRMAFQPVINIETGECASMEALCRWHHSEFGAVAPNHFLPYVEKTPLIMPLTECTLGLSLKSLDDMEKQGYSGSQAINLSSSLFQSPDLVERLLEQIRFFSIDPKVIHFEITETSIMQHPKLASSLLSELREGGCSISVDDFGTGHSSLAYLADLPIDTIKIDRHFVDHVDQPWGEAIVGATAVLADKLGLTTIAEGIENKEQLERCQALGVTFAQGYHLGRPMFHEDFNVWLQGTGKAPSI